MSQRTKSYLGFPAGKLQRRGVRRRKVTRKNAQRKVDLYIEKIASKGASKMRFSVSTLVETLELSERTVYSARAALDEKWNFVHVREGRSTVLYVVFDQPKEALPYRRIEAWFRAAQKRSYRGKDWCSADARYLSSRTGIPLETVETVIATMRQDHPEHFRISANGILIYIFHPANSGGTIGGKDFSSRNRDKLKHRTGPAAQAKAAVDGERGLRRKAWWVARKCVDKHWDNCKVRVSLRHAYCYALRALKAGKRDADIIAAYDAALHQRHKDATDAGLSCGNPRLVWEPSSTVSLATAMLAGAAGLDEDQRKAKRAVAWLGTLGREAYAAFRHWFDAAGESLDALYGETVELFAIVGRYLRWQREQGRAA